VGREVFKVAQTLPDLFVGRTTKYLFFQDISSRAVRKLGNFDTCTAEPLLGIVGEKEQCDIGRYAMVIDSIGKPGMPIDCANIRFVDQTTAYVL